MPPPPRASIRVADVKELKTSQTPKIGSLLCYCGDESKKLVTKKEGPNCGRPFEACDNQVWDAVNKRNVGGCSYFRFTDGEETVYGCTACGCALKDYKCLNSTCSKYVPRYDRASLTTQVVKLNPHHFSLLGNNNVCAACETTIITTSDSKKINCRCVHGCSSVTYHHVNNTIVKK